MSLKLKRNPEKKHEPWSHSWFLMSATLCSSMKVPRWVTEICLLSSMFLCHDSLITLSVFLWISLLRCRFESCSFLEERSTAMISKQGGSEEQLSPYNIGDLGSALPSGAAGKPCVWNYSQIVFSWLSSGGLCVFEAILKPRALFVFCSLIVFNLEVYLVLVLRVSDKVHAHF